MAVKRINIQKLLNTAKAMKEMSENDIKMTWSKRELVDLIVYIIESLKP